MNTLDSSDMEGLVARILCNVHLNSSPDISISAVAFCRVLPFASTASFIASFSIAFPAPLVMSGQASPAASFSFIKLCQLMEPAPTHHRFLIRQLHGSSPLKIVDTSAPLYGNLRPVYFYFFFFFSVFNLILQNRPLCFQFVYCFQIFVQETVKSTCKLKVKTENKNRKKKKK